MSRPNLLNIEKLTLTELARRCGKCLSTINKKIADGYTKAEILKLYNKNDLKLFGLTDAQEIDSERLTTKAKLEKAKLELTEQGVEKLRIQNAKIRGELIGIDDVNELFIFFASIVKATLKSTSNQLVTMLEGKSAVEISPIIDNAINNALDTVSEEVINRIEEL